MCNLIIVSKLSNVTNGVCMITIIRKTINIVFQIKNLLIHLLLLPFFASSKHTWIMIVTIKSVHHFTVIIRFMTITDTLDKKDRAKRIDNILQ